MLNNVDMNTNYIQEKPCHNVKVVERNDGKYGVVDINENVIVPFGKYAWIDGFDHGLARVRVGYSPNVVAAFALDGRINDLRKWGIINEKGEEVLPVEYDNIWKFYGKNRFSTKVVKNGVERDVYFCDLNPSLPARRGSRKYYMQNNCESYNYENDTWDALTDGQYGDMPEGFDGDYSFMGF